MHVYLFKVIYIFSGEIDRCLKKVQEGVDIFEDLWQKVSCFVGVALLNIFCTKVLFLVCVKHVSKCTFNAGILYFVICLSAECKYFCCIVEQNR